MLYGDLGNGGNFLIDILDSKRLRGGKPVVCGHNDRVFAVLIHPEGGIRIRDRLTVERDALDAGGTDIDVFHADKVAHIRKLLHGGGEGERRCDVVALHGYGLGDRAFHTDGVDRLKVIGIAAVGVDDERVALDRPPGGVGIRIVGIRKAVHRVCGGKRQGHVARRPAAGIIARVHRNDRVAVHDDREVCRSRKPRVRISDGDLLLHIEKRRVKGAVIHRVVRDLLGSGVAVIRRDSQPLQVKLILAFVVGIARIFKCDVRQFFGFERDGEHTAVTCTRARDGHNDVLLGIQNALVDLADRVIRDFHGKIAVRPAGRIVILADCLTAVIELYFQPCEVKLGFTLDVIRARGCGDRDAFGFELDNGDVLGRFRIRTVHRGQALMGKVPHRCAARSKTRDRAVVVHARYTVLLITAGAVPVGFPRSAAVIIGHAPMHVFYVQARRGVGCRVGDGEVPDDIVTACNGSRYQFTENAAIDRNMRADGYPADCGGDRRIAAVPRVRTTGVHPRDLAVFIDRDGSWIGRSPDYGIQQCRVIIGRLDVAQFQLYFIALSKTTRPAEIPIYFK